MMEVAGKPEENAGRDEEKKAAGGVGASAETVKALSNEGLDKVSGGMTMLTPCQ